jgi:hypothetical protein
MDVSCMGDALDPFEGQYVEICPDCNGGCGGCVTCFDAGVVPHRCDEEDDD